MNEKDLARRRPVGRPDRVWIDRGQLTHRSNRFDPVHPSDKHNDFTAGGYDNYGIW